MFNRIINTPGGWILLLALAIGPCFAHAQPAPTAAPPAANPTTPAANPRAEVEQTLLNFQKAFNERSETLLRDLTHPEFTAILLNDIVIGDLTLLLDYQNKSQLRIGPEGSIVMALEIKSVQFTGGDGAILTGGCQFDIRTGAAQEYQLPGQFSAALSRTAGGWRVLRFHGSIDPMSNQLIARRFEIVLFIGMAGSAMVGAIMSVTLLWCIRRIRADRRAAAGQPANPSQTKGPADSNPPDSPVA